MLRYSLAIVREGRVGLSRDLARPSPPSWRIETSTEGLSRGRFPAKCWTKMSGLRPHDYDGLPSQRDNIISS